MGEGATARRPYLPDGFEQTASDRASTTTAFDHAARTTRDGNLTLPR